MRPAAECGFRRPDLAGVAERSTPFLVLYALSLLLLLTPEVQVGSGALVVLSVGTAVAAQLVAWLAPWDRLPTVVQLAVPVLQLAAVGPLRQTTGGAASLFTALVIPPVIAIASDRRRLSVLVAVVGTAGVLLLPAVLTGAVTTVVDLVRAVVTPVALGVAALTVNELSRRLRARLQTVTELQAEQTALLAQAEARTAELELLSRRLAATTETITSVIDAVTQHAVIGTDPDGLVRVWNPGAERMLGLPRADVVRTRSVLDFLEPAELDPADPVATLVARAGDERARDATLVRADGTRLTATLAVTPRHDSAGAPAGWNVVATDVSAERSEARLKDEFVGLVSHELRTPLSSILGYLELVVDDEDTPLDPGHRAHLLIVERNAQRLLRLVGDLLLTAQVEAGRFSLDVREVDLRTVVTAARDTACPAALTAGVELVVDLPDEPLVVAGDPDRLGQAVDNLLGNAVKYTPRGGRVTVGLHRGWADPDGLAGAPDDTWRRVPVEVARITVRDTGLGIPADEQGELFSRFFRSSNARRQGIAGVGLGLTVTQAIVTAHAGRTDLRSSCGEGTTATVSLPLAVPVPAAPGTVGAGAR